MPFFGGVGKYKIVGNNNIDGGENALTNLTSGANNIAIGNNTLTQITSESDNIAIGTNALNVTTGFNNISLGTDSAFSTTTGSENVVIGPTSFYNNVTGERNVIIGYGALDEAFAASFGNSNDNVTVGHLSGGSQAGDVFDNVFVGSSSGNSRKYTSGNTAVGAYSFGGSAGDGSTVNDNNNTVIGYLSAYLTGISESVIIGSEAGYFLNPASDSIVVIGTNALNQVVNGVNPVDGSTRQSAIDSVVIGNKNFYSPSSNPNVGLKPNNVISLGNDNLTVAGVTTVMDVVDCVFIGNNIQVIVDTDPLNRIVIGNDIANTADNSIVIGDNTHTAVFIGGKTITNGQYTPVLTNQLNITSSTAFESSYLQIGNTVTLSGTVTVEATAAGPCILGISLPVPSNFGNSFDLSGTVNFQDTVSLIFYSGLCFSDDANDRARLDFTAAGTDPLTMSYTFTYQVI